MGILVKGVSILYNGLKQVLVPYWLGSGYTTLQHNKPKKDDTSADIYLYIGPIQKCDFSFFLVANEHQNQKMRSKRLGYLEVIVMFDVQIPPSWEVAYF